MVLWPFESFHEPKAVMGLGEQIGRAIGWVYGSKLGPHPSLGIPGQLLCSHSLWQPVTAAPIN